MYHELDLSRIEKTTARHLIIANLGYCIANTKEKGILKKIKYTVQCFTSTLIEENAISQEEIVNIIESICKSSNNSSYGSIDKYKGDELIDSTILFHSTQIIEGVRELTFFNNFENPLHSFLCRDKWYKERFNKKYIAIKNVYYYLFSLYRAVKFVPKYKENIEKHKKENNKLKDELVEAIYSIEFSIKASK